MRRILVGLLTATMIMSLLGCGGGTNNSDAGSKDTKKVKEEAAEPTDLSGTWQSEDNDGSWMEAVISDSTIEINWISDNGSTKSIYWIGTYEAPEEEVAEYTWTSERDKEKTDQALLASTDDTKEFEYKDEKISYEVTVAGTTTTVSMTRTGNVPDETAGEADEEATQEDDGIIDFSTDSFTVKYVRHEFGTDYEGNKVLLYYYNFTNTGDDNTVAGYVANVQCFQDGSECETATMTDYTDSMNNYAINEVQPGGTVEVCQCFKLKSNTEITIEASELISFGNQKDTQKIAAE